MMSEDSTQFLPDYQRSQVHEGVDLVLLLAAEWGSIKFSGMGNICETCGYVNKYPKKDSGQSSEDMGVHILDTET